MLDDTMWEGMKRLADSPNAVERQIVLDFVALALEEGWMSEGTAANFFGGRLEARGAVIEMKERIEAANHEG